MTAFCDTSSESIGAFAQHSPGFQTMTELDDQNDQFYGFPAGSGFPSVDGSPGGWPGEVDLSYFGPPSLNIDIQLNPQDPDLVISPSTVPLINQTSATLQGQSASGTSGLSRPQAPQRGSARARYYGDFTQRSSRPTQTTQAAYAAFQSSARTVRTPFGSNALFPNDTPFGNVNYGSPSRGPSFNFEEAPWTPEMQQRGSDASQADFNLFGLPSETPSEQMLGPVSEAPGYLHSHSGSFPSDSPMSPGFMSSRQLSASSFDAADAALRSSGQALIPDSLLCVPGPSLVRQPLSEYSDRLSIEGAFSCGATSDPDWCMVQNMSESSGSPFPIEKEEPASPHSSLSEGKTGAVFVNHFQAEAIPSTKREAAVKGPTRRPSKRQGGRARGTHLARDKADKVKELRGIGSCWLCAIQRDECTPGNPCDRCTKRAQRPQADLVLGCDRTKLPDLKEHFIPGVITSLHDTNTLKNFINRNIRSWTGNTIRIKFMFIEGLPGLDYDVVEFEPKTMELLRQFQYVTDPTGKQERREKVSPPLGIRKFDSDDTKIWERYLNELIADYLDKFAKICFFEEDERIRIQTGLSSERPGFQTSLLKLMCELKPSDEKEKMLLREMFRLLMVTFIIGHTVTIPDEKRDQYLSKLTQNDFRTARYDEYCSPRMANRQFKYFFLVLQQEIMKNVLGKLQFLIRSSKGCTKWTSAFCTILGLAMVLEDQQRTIHLVTDTDFAQGKITAEGAARQAEDTCRVIDDQFMFLASLFRWKYNRQFNPLRDGVDKKNAQLFEPAAVRFINEVNNLVREKSEYLRAREHINISTENQEKYTSRLVARFLLSFFGPESPSSR